MERALIAIASAAITGAIFLSAFLLLQFVWPLMIVLVAHPHLAQVLLPMFFGVWALLCAILAIIFRSRHDMTRSLNALLGAMNMALFGGFYLMPFARPLVTEHHFAPTAFAGGIFAIWIAVELVILRRIMILARLNREST